MDIPQVNTSLPASEPFLTFDVTLGEVQMWTVKLEHFAKPLLTHYVHIVKKKILGYWNKSPKVWLSDFGLSSWKCNGSVFALVVHFLNCVDDIPFFSVQERYGMIKLIMSILGRGKCSLNFVPGERGVTSLTSLFWARAWRWLRYVLSVAAASCMLKKAYALFLKQDVSTALGWVSWCVSWGLKEKKTSVLSETRAPTAGLEGPLAGVQIYPPL